MRTRLLTLWYPFLCLATANSGIVHASEIVIGTGEFPPYTTEQADDQGCVNSIIRNAYEAEGWSVTFRYLPWPRNLVLLSRGEIEASSFWAKRSDRLKEYIFPNNALTAVHYKFIFPKEKIIFWETYEDLRGKSIVINLNYTYNEEFRRALDDIFATKFEVSSEIQNLTMVARGRADLTIMSEKVFEKYVGELSVDEQSRLQVDRKPALTIDGFLIFSKANSAKSQKLAEVFDEGYEKVRQREDLQAAFTACGL